MCIQKGKIYPSEESWRLLVISILILRYIKIFMSKSILQGYKKRWLAFIKSLQCFKNFTKLIYLIITKFILENSLAISEIIKHSHHSNFILVLYPKEIKTQSYKSLYVNIHSSIIHNDQKVETTKMFITWWMGKLNVAQFIQWNLILQ